MARRRKSYRRKGRRSKKGRSRRSKGSMATEAGGAITLYQIAGRNSLGGQMPIPYLIKNPNTQGMKDVITIVKANAKRGDTYTPLLGGAAIHWAKNKPFLKIVLGPVDKLSKQWFHKGL